MMDYNLIFLNSPVQLRGRFIENSRQEQVENIVCIFQRKKEQKILFESRSCHGENFIGMSIFYGGKM